MKKMGKAMYGKSMMMTGGMTNSNAKISVDKTPGSKGTTVGLNPNAVVSPTAKYGMTMKNGGAKPKMMKGGAKTKAMYGASMKPGMMKKGGAKKK